MATDEASHHSTPPHSFTSPQSKVVIIAVGGPTCSGKTTLAKHLRQILPNSIILHQDDFAPPAQEIPLHPVHNVQDWDDPKGAIDWPRLRSVLQYIRTHAGQFPPSHASHDHLNQQPDLPISQALIDEWKTRFVGRSDEIRYVIADGFLLYWDSQIVEHFDVKLFVRESYAILKERRRIRQSYNTGDGETWVDPPRYWDEIVWPAYLTAHQQMFVGHDVESGELDRSHWAGKDVVILEAKVDESSTETMRKFVERSLKAIWDHLNP